MVGQSWLAVKDFEPAADGGEGGLGLGPGGSEKTNGCRRVVKQKDVGSGCFISRFSCHQRSCTWPTYQVADFDV
jgi:hypothetical protein